MPHPPIWVGGDSPGAFRRVVTLGDGWHATSKTPAKLRDSLARLRKTADAARRLRDDRALAPIRPQRRASLPGQQQAVVDRLCEYKQLGLGHVLLEFRRDDLVRMLEILELVARTIRPAVDAA